MKPSFRFLLVLIAMAAMVAIALACYPFGVERTNEQKFTQLNTGTLESNGVRTRIRVIPSDTSPNSPVICF